MTKEERARVESKLLGALICERCGATLETYADACTARLDEACPGFMAVEEASKP
jgi:ribosomal protein L40E